MVTDSKIKSLLCLKAAMDKKAEEAVLLDMTGTSSFTDYFLICSGRSDRQVQAIARGIEEALEKEGIKPGTDYNPYKATDLAPTLSEIMGIPKPEQSKGRTINGIRNTENQ